MLNQVLAMALIDIEVKTKVLQLWQCLNLIEIFQMILQEPFGWVWEVRFKGIQNQKRSTTGSTKYYTASRQQQEDQPNNTTTLKVVLENLQQEHLLVNKIADAKANNELASDSQQDYSTDQLIQTFKQKYYPPANDTQINSVLSNLANYKLPYGRVEVAIIINMEYQTTSTPHGIDIDRDCNDFCL